MKIYKSRLEAKVEGKNEVNRRILELLPSMLEALKPFVGTKCFNQGTAISAKLRAALPVLPNTVELSAHYTTGCGYSLRADFKVTTQWPTDKDYCGTHYTEQSVYLGDIQGLTLSRLYDNHEFRTDYSVDEVLMARYDLKDAQAAVSRAQSRLCCFGEHDNF